MYRSLPQARLRRSRRKSCTLRRGDLYLRHMTRMRLQELRHKTQNLNSLIHKILTFSLRKGCCIVMMPCDCKLILSRCQSPASPSWTSCAAIPRISSQAVRSTPYIKGFFYHQPYIRIHHSAYLCMIDAPYGNLGHRRSNRLDSLSKRSTSSADRDHPCNLSKSGNLCLLASQIHTIGNRESGPHSLE